MPEYVQIIIKEANLRCMGAKEKYCTMHEKIINDSTGIHVLTAVENERGVLLPQIFEDYSRNRLELVTCAYLSHNKIAGNAHE